MLAHGDVEQRRVHLLASVDQPLGHPVEGLVAADLDAVGQREGRRAGEQRGQDEAESAVGVRVHGSLLFCVAFTP